MDIQEQIKAELARIAAEAGTVNAELRKFVQDSIDRVSTAMQRLGRSDKGVDFPRVPTDEDRAFNTWLRKGQEALTPDMHKALTVGNDPGAGYLAPAFFSNRIEAFLRELSTIVQRARPFEFSAGELDLPQVTSGTSATWVGEEEQRPETTLTVGMNTLILHELACYVDLSNRLLDDASVNIEDVLSEDLGSAFASAFNAAILAGNGVKKPLGIMSGAPGVVRVPSGHAANLLPDALIDATMAIPAALLQSPCWVMSRGTVAIVRKMKGVANDHYLWQPSLVVGQPPTLLGYEVLTDENMPAVAGGNSPVLFGSFRRGLAVGRKPGSASVSILRDPFSIATTGKTRFHARKRAGSVVYRGAAFARIEIAAT